MIHFNSFTFLLATVCLVAVASILSRIFPKRSTKMEIPKTSTPTDVLVDDYKEHQEFLRHKYLASKYEQDEPVTIQKALKGFIQGKTWAKSLVLGIIMCIIAFVGYSMFKEVTAIFGKKPTPITNTITNTGDGKVESKTESKSSTKTSNGLNLNLLSGWF